MKNDKFKNMTDEQLVKISHPSIWRSDDEGLARAELYKREKAKEGKNFSVQKQIRNMTSVMSHLICYINYGILVSKKGGAICQRLSIGSR